MKRFVVFTLALLMPSLAICGGHTGLGGTGTAVVVDTKKMEGVSGVLIQQTTNDVWIWDNPPEGFPKATSATCNQFIAFAPGEQQPVGGAFTCQSVDPDGDVSIATGAFQANGTALITQVAGTGKWAAYNGTQSVGKTDIQVDASTSTYSWTPVN